MFDPRWYFKEKWEVFHGLIKVSMYLDKNIAATYS